MLKKKNNNDYEYVRTMHVRLYNYVYYYIR